MNNRIGFIGLGNMGMPMAKNLIASGFHLQVYNRTLSKTDELDAGSITVCKTPAAAGDGVPILISMLSQDDIVKDIVYGPEGILSTFPNGAVHISMSTIAPETSVELAEQHRSSGSNYIAAPVFGRPAAVESRQLFICISGGSEAKEIAKPVLQLLGRQVIDFGENAGGANVVKVTGNFMIIASLEMMAEAFTLAEKNGLDRVQVAEFFGTTLFNAPIYQNYGKLIANRQYEPVSFTSKLAYKDTRLAVRLAQTSQTPMPMATLAHNRLMSAVAKGWGEQDMVEGVARGVTEDAGI